MEKLKSSTAMSKFCCIVDLICLVINKADGFFVVHDAFVLMTGKETINWMRQNGYLHRWLLPHNGLYNRTPYAGRPVGNSPEFMPLDNSLNHDILHSLHMHSFLSCYILNGGATNKEERNMCFSYSTLRGIARGLKRIWDSKMGTPSSAKIIEDVDLALKALGIACHTNGAAIEGLADRNGHRCKEVCEGEGVSWGGTRAKGEGRECELTKKMFFHNHLLQLYLKKKQKITEFFPDTTVFYD